jgi:hypothetical protein
METPPPNDITARPHEKLPANRRHNQQQQDHTDNSDLLSTVRPAENLIIEVKT